MMELWDRLSMVQKFIVKIVLAVIIWKILYINFLQPIRIPDKLLTHIISAQSAALINLLNPTLPPAIAVSQVNYPAYNIVRGQQYLIGIHDGCNGLELILMYVSLILFLPYPRKRKFIFALVGTLILIWANVFRCVLLQWIYHDYKNLFETTHHYLFTLFMYIIIFTGWILFVQKNKANA